MSLRNLDDLAVFVHVVERQSFSAAARDLHLAPKTVSKQIARLEQALGTTLFERNTRNLRITGEGRAIAERARVALGVLEEVQELASGASQELSGTIRLTAPTPFGRKFVAPAIHDFCRLHPRVGFDLRLSDQVQDLYSGDLDMAIRMGELADSRLVARRVADNRRILAASPAYLKAHGQPAQPEELERHNCLVFAYPGLLQNTWPLRKGRREKPVAVSGTLCSDNGDVLHAWCLAGLGISLRETWDIHEELRDGRLVRVLPDWEATPSKISIVRARREPVPRRLTAFSDFLLERWQNAPWDR
ncbi:MULTISPECIES: LysR family transcriptional regulator [Gammaproteobacteria]|uniref:LysR family transcriptional regulator n=1 Tax=Pseudomonas veronii TaxID=76761 RepID=A0ABS0VCR4_PSEVE|nr:MULTISPECIES: LysR family transcriptional regulator [Gammaproteobacteria]MBI6551901.1 LysR family transcriptional regulator [Pseudomonas veronii]MBI6649299.1 LysR family transcriptional regulator [Pseudomonas veronii]MDH0186874.1 LysR family transcriptional regulator [Stenotrophomonas sp. GD04051]MDH0465002.1 LysR family transcriptional regulator [Stenotrophomonas sp. GD03993]MDH0875786.1 LysR family transcriptional regulator [Stenotrophomonas sp. GD03877]